MNTTNLRSLALASLLLALLSGCVVGPRHHPYHRHKRPVYQGASASRDSCPPGHRWSDGRCHRGGKGHDPQKHAGKHHGKHR